ncbi:uncharacterized protein IL334_005279 [Kwoniella shivajii]|uniref:Uncharacterized protein n=1 Tax=Kwoniella shivajii TaxID=564305 RepID=A0ABZ1D2Q3_9TREE|nr:hypothetical protein IL334_005279 [Kwoniella shivajii]
MQFTEVLPTCHSPLRSASPSSPTMSQSSWSVLDDVTDTDSSEDDASAPAASDSVILQQTPPLTSLDVPDALSICRSRIADLEKQVNILKGQVSEYAFTSQNQSEEITEVRSKLNNLEEEKRYSSVELDPQTKSQEDAIMYLEHQLAEEKIKTLGNRLDQIDKKICQELDMSPNELKLVEMTEEIKSLTAEQDQLVSGMENRYQSMSDKLSKQVSLNSDLKYINENLNTTIDFLKKEIERLGGNSTNLEKFNSTIDVLKKENHKLLKQNQEYVKEERKKEIEYQNHTEMLRTENEDLKKKNQKLSKVFEKSKGELEDEYEELEKSRNDVVRLEPLAGELENAGKEA